MTTPTVPVTVTLVSQEGVPYQGVTVRARLDVNEIYQGIVISDEVSAVTDAGGVAVLNCFPNAPSPSGLGSQGSTYRFWAAIPNGRSMNLNARVLNAPCRLENILVDTEGVPLSAAELAILQAQGSANAAAASAAQAQVSADAANASVVAATAQAGVATTQAGISTTNRAAIDNRLYPGTYSLAPTTRPDGSAIQNGDRYINSADGLEYMRVGGLWSSAAVQAQAAAASAAAAAGSATTAQNWAEQTGSDVTGAPANSRSSKSWAQENLAGASLGGSSKDWAQSASKPDGVNESAKTYATNAAASAAVAASAGVYPSAAASNVPRGLTQTSVGAITPGAGGTNGTFALGWSGGNFSINPTGTFTVAGGVVTAVTITGPGLYIGASPTVPTPSFAASSGLTGAAVALTAQFLVTSGQGYWVQNADNRTLDRYKNVSGVATSDTTNVKPIPNGDTLLESVFFAGESGTLSAQTTTILTGDNILLREVPYEGTIEAVFKGGSSGGTVTLREFSRDGRTFTKVGADLGSVTLTAGNESTLRSNRAVSRGNYLGFSAAIGTVAGITPPAGRALRSGGYVSGPFNGNPIVASTATVDREPQVRFSVLANSGSVEAEARRGDDLNRIGHGPGAVFGGGRRALFANNSTISSRVVCFDAPAPCAGRVRVRAVGGPVAGWVRVTRQRKTGSVFEATSQPYDIELTAGQKDTFDLDLRVEAGDYVGFSMDSGGIDFMSGIQEGSGHFLLSTEGMYTSAPALQTGTDYMISYEVIPDEPVSQSSRKVLVLGDSIWDITANASWCSSLYMEYELGDRQVVNCAIGGTTISAEKLGDPFYLGTYAKFSAVKIAQAIGSGNFSELDAALIELAALPAPNGKDASPQINQIKALNFNEVETIVFTHGTNDFGNSLVLGSATDEVISTFRGSINKIVEYIRGTYPYIKLVFVTPMYRHRVFVLGDTSDTTPNASGKYLIEYVDAEIDQAGKSHAHCLDLYRNLGFGPENGTAIFGADGLHTSNAIAIRLMGERIAKFIKYQT